jgi:imidazolonepropionase-like amidohydrolase
MPAFLRAGWDPAKDARFKDRTAADWERARRSYAMQLTLIKPMAAAGVPIVAGTDVLNPYIIAGFSLHDELQLFVENGLTPLQALRAATIVPARLLNATDSLGTVAQGKVADLVLLDANPLTDIRNTTHIRAVISNGRVFLRPALDSLLANAEKLANPQSAPRR